jgi:hypothetical protein
VCWRWNVTPSVVTRIVDCAPAIIVVPSVKDCVHQSVPRLPVGTRVQDVPS